MESMIEFTFDNLAILLGGSVAIGLGMAFLVWLVGFGATLLIIFFKHIL